NVPAVVFAAMDDRDFFDAVLADIADPEISGEAVEAEAPWFAKAKRPDFRPRIAPAAKGIVARDGVSKTVVAFVQIDPDDFAEEQLCVLAMALRVLLRASVAHAEIQITVRAKVDTAAAVVLGGAHYLQEAKGRLSRIALQVRRGFPFREDSGDLTVLKNLVLEVILPIFAEFRMKGDAE